MTTHNYETIKSAFDYISATSAIAAFFGWLTLPNVAALLTALWLFFRLLNEIHKWRTRNERMGRRKDD